MSRLGLELFMAGATAALVDAQLELDERGRESLDAFGETGVPPTVLSWTGCRLSCPVRVDFVPRRTAAGATRATVGPHGPGTLSFALRYFAAAQGEDDPAPRLEAP